MSIFRRIIGVIMIIIGIVGLIIAGAGAVFANRAVDAAASSFNSAVEILSTTVDTTTASLDNVKLTLVETGTTLNTVSDTAVNMARTLVDTQPLLQQVTVLTTDTLPNSLDAVNTAVPNLAGIAGTIDTTLSRLSDLKVERRVAGIPLSFDLGINYNPREPFDAAVLEIGESLIGVPEQLRSLEQSLQVAVTNIGSVGDNIDELAANIDGINSSVGGFVPLLDQYIGVLNQTKSSLENTQAQINANLNTIKWVAFGLLTWFALYQIVPLYVGYRMVSDKVVEGGREEREAEKRAGEVVSMETAGAADRAEEAAAEVAEKIDDAVDKTKS